MAHLQRDEWDDLFGEEQEASQSDSLHLDEACDACASSDSEYASPQGLDACWWVSKCRQAFAAEAIPWPRASEGLSLVSCCTGCSAESAVMEALRGRVQGTAPA